MRLRRVLAAAMIPLATGCSADPDASVPTPSRTPSPTADGSAHASESTAKSPRFALDLQQAQILSPGDGLDVLRKISTNTRDIALLGNLDDGRLLLRRGNALRLETPVGHLTTTIRTPSPEAARGVFNLDDDGRHLVWITTTARDYFTFPWQMWSLDLRTGVVRRIARHHDVGVKPVPVGPNGTQPRLLGGRVYFAAVHEVKENGRVIPAVYSVPADGSEPPRLEENRAYDPHAFDGRLVYSRSAFGFVDWELHSRLPGRPSTDRILARGPGKRQRLSGVESDGETLVLQPKRGRRCSLRFIARESETLMLGPDRCGRVWSAYHEIGGDWVAFSTGSGPYRTYVCRLEDGALFRLTAARTFGITHGSGDIITWRPARGPDKGKTIVARMTLE